MAPYVFFSSWVSPAKTWWPKIENVVAKNWKLSINWAFGKIGRLRARSDFAIHPSDSYIDNVRKTGELSEHLPRCNVVKMHLCSAGAQKITRWVEICRLYYIWYNEPAIINIFYMGSNPICRMCPGFYVVRHERKNAIVFFLHCIIWLESHLWHIILAWDN